MSHSVEERIQIELDRIEQQEAVRVLYACESGSRAWGFESEDSYFDVRFIYIRPPRWYRTIKKTFTKGGNNHHQAGLPKGNLINKQPGMKGDYV